MQLIVITRVCICVYLGFLLFRRLYSCCVCILYVSYSKECAENTLITQESINPVKGKKRWMCNCSTRITVFLPGTVHSWEPGYLSQYNDWLRIGRPSFDPWQRQRIFPLASASRPALRPTQPTIQWVPGVLSPGVKRGRGVTLTTHSHLVPRLRMNRSYISSLPKRFHGV
jgi:hypothetical protein